MEQKKLPSEATLESIADYVSKIIEKESGNLLTEKQKPMVLSRLAKRLLTLGNLTPQQYKEHLERHYEEEIKGLISLLTTHHTFFFREFCHFEYILDNLSTIVERVKKRGDDCLRLWSAACSQGQEVYSLAMFFEKHLKELHPDMKYEILGTDIDSDCIKVAKNGVYQYKDVKSIPALYLQGNWQRGTGEIAQFAKVKAHLKQNVDFRPANLLKRHELQTSKKFDIIFCRNVFIYLNQEDIVKICLNFKQSLHPEGLLITGLSESLKYSDLKTHSVGPNIYTFETPEAFQKPTLISMEKESTTTAPASIERPQIKYPIRIFSVDDSGSILKLLGKMFGSDKDFEFIGSAMNGEEAHEKLKNLEVDLITLDIHMPTMNGIEYLENYFNSNHPKVLIISSASREDTRYAQRALDLGAYDFVEKPNLQNFGKCFEEIKTKIKMCLLDRKGPGARDTRREIYERNFNIEKPEAGCRILIAHLSEVDKVAKILKEGQGTQPPCFVLFEGNASYLELAKKQMMDQGILNCSLMDDHHQNIENDKVYLGDFGLQIDNLNQLVEGRNKSIGVLGLCTEETLNVLVGMERVSLMVEEILNQHLEKIPDDAEVFPWTSFSHVGTEFLSKEEKK